MHYKHRRNDTKEIKGFSSTRCGSTRQAMFMSQAHNTYSVLCTQDHISSLNTIGTSHKTLKNTLYLAEKKVIVTLQQRDGENNTQQMKNSERKITC